MGGVAQLDPQVLDTVDLDEAVREYQTLIDAPAKLIVPVNEVKAIRQQRAQQQQAERDAMLAQAGADATAKLSQAEKNEQA